MEDIKAEESPEVIYMPVTRNGLQERLEWVPGDERLAPALVLGKIKVAWTMDTEVETVQSRLFGFCFGGRALKT